MRPSLWLAVALALTLQQSPVVTAPSTWPAPVPVGSKVWIGHYREYEDFLRTVVIARLEPAKLGKIAAAKHAFFQPDGLAASGALRTLRPGLYKGYFESYRSEVAAYKLDRLLQLDMVPPAVERTYNGDNVSLQLWSENTRLLKDVREQKIAFPATLEMLRQFSRQKVFDDLVANIDADATDISFDPVWNIIKVDHSRCFTKIMMQPFEVGVAGRGVSRIDRAFFDRNKALDKATLQAEIGKYVEGEAIDALLVRRNKIVKQFETLAKQKGDAAVFLP